MSQTSHFKIWESASETYLEASDSDPELFYTNFGQSDRTWRNLIHVDWFRSAIENNHPAGYRIEELAPLSA
jgi:hypothetical protein